jgi:hypothetical protein
MDHASFFLIEYHIEPLRQGRRRHFRHSAEMETLHFGTKPKIFSYSSSLENCFQKWLTNPVSSCTIFIRRHDPRPWIVQNNKKENEL